MQMMEKIFDFIDNYKSAFIVGTYPEKKLIFHNKASEEFYGISNNLSNFYQMLECCNLSLEKKIKSGFLNNDYEIIENVITKKIDGTSQISNLNIGYFNKEKTEIFLEITPTNETKIKMRTNQVKDSLKPKGIVEFDDNLTVLSCNASFCELINIKPYNYTTKKYINLIDLFKDDQKEFVLRDIKKSLQNSKPYFTELQIEIEPWKFIWITLELEPFVTEYLETKFICTLECIEERKQEMHFLKSHANYFDALQSLTDQSFYVVDVKNNILRQSGQIANELGIVADISNFPQSLFSVVHDDDLQAFKDYTFKSFDGFVEGSLQMRIKTPNEGYKWYEITSLLIKNEQNEVVEILGKINNIDKVHQIEEENSMLNQYFIAMNELCDDILYRIEIDTMTLQHLIRNDKSRIFGNILPDYISTFTKEKIIPPEDVETYVQNLKDWIDGKIDEYQARFALHSDKYEWYNVRGIRIYDENGNLKEILGALINIQKEKELEKQASLDLMTRVLNKVGFETEVEAILKYSDKTQKHALVFIDLDNFKNINDTSGHAFGDFLLTTVGKRLKRVVRDSDLVGRVGGDEFAVFFRNTHSEELALERAKSLLDVLNKEFNFDGKTQSIKANLGISIFPNHGENYIDLLKKTDKALHTSKEIGKNAISLYSQNS